MLIALSLLATACGGGDSVADTTTNHGSTTNHGTTTAGDDDGDESTFTVTTTLDLGQPFAEDPHFDGTLGHVDVHVRADRTGEPSQIPITFQLINAGETDLEEVVFTIGFTVIASPNPDAPPVPGPDDPPLELAAQTTQGTCTSEDTTSSATSVVCTLGTLAVSAEATVTVTSPQWFNLDTDMKLTARAE
jgi:hypothetical protein